MQKVAWIAAAIAIVGVAGFLHWSLPNREVVRIVGTEVARMGATDAPRDDQPLERTRDVWFITAASADGESRVYRNEDTGWGWPPYFKFDSVDLAAEADDHTSTGENPQWVVVTSYGWRIPILSMFPNALSVRPAESVDEGLFPWFNVIVVLVLIGGVAWIWSRLSRWFRHRS